MIDVGVAHVGTGGIDAPEEHKASGIVVDLITLETETSCWYLGLVRNFAVENQSLTMQIRDSQHRIFTEDLKMLKSQQARLLETLDVPVNLNIDRGGMHAQILDELIAGESNILRLP